MPPATRKLAAGPCKGAEARGQEGPLSAAAPGPGEPLDVRRGEARPAAAAAQAAPRLEVAAGTAVPARGDGPFEFSGPAMRLTARSGGAATRLALRLDLGLSWPGLAGWADSYGDGDLTAFTLGAEWAVGGTRRRASGLRPYAALGFGVATGYYGAAGGGEDGRASGMAVSAAFGARRTLGRATVGLEVGYTAYGAVRRTNMVPVTLALGF